MRTNFCDQRQRLHDNARRLVAAATVFADPCEAGRMLDQAIALKTRERTLGRLAAR